MQQGLTCFSLWNGRIAPVFDASRHWLLVDCAAGAVQAQRPYTCAAREPIAVARELVALDVKHLVCGAISVEWRQAIEAQEIAVVGFVCGDVAEIIEQWVQGLFQPLFYAMPGCCKRRQRVRGQGVYR